MENLCITIILLSAILFIVFMVWDNHITRKYVRSLFKSVERLEEEMGIETTAIPFTREFEHYQLNCVPKRLDRIRDFYRYPNYRDKVLSDKEPTPQQDKE